jgi:hypothetical protein
MLTQMKKIAYTFFMLAAVIATSCSGDDNNNSGNTVETTADYMPLTNSNYWVYNTNTTGAANTSGRDSLYVAKDTVIGTVTYKKIKSRAAATGFFSGSLSGNAIRQDGSKLLVTGNTSVSLSEQIPFNIAITEFAFFDANATSGQQIGSTSGSFQQTIQGFPLTFTYTLKTTAGDNISSETVNNIAYTGVKTVITTLQLKISLDLLSLVILPEQNVVTSTQYFADGVGAIKTSTDIRYTLADITIPGITLPIPQSGSAQQDEILVAYNVQ